MIIVIALMGSILAGYALNINGTSTVMNEYEKVTDVSGLYTHSQEPAYIDYNPASNYIGYEIEQTVYENVATNTTIKMKKMVDGDTITITTSGITFGNKHYSLPNFDRPVFVSSWGYVYSVPGNPGIYWTSSEGDYYVSTITLTWSSNTLTVSNSSDNYSKGTGIAPSFYYPYDDYDMAGGDRRELYYNINNSAPTLMLGGINPRYNNNNLYVTGTPTWVSYRCFPYGDEVTPGGVVFHWDNDQIISNNVNKGLPTVDVTYNGAYFENPWFVVAPRYIYADNPLGIDYTESNRVNNYPVPNSSSTISSTSSQTINVSNLTGITNYMPASNQYNITMYEGANVGKYNNGSQDITVSNANYYMPASTMGSGNTQLGLLNYKLSDILTAGATIPANTKQIKIDLASNNSIAYNRNLNITNYIDYCDLNIPTLNNGVFVTNNAYSNVFGNYTLKVNNGFGVKDYAIYDINENIVTIYSYNGVKKSTLTPDNCYIASTNLNGYNSNNMILTYTAEQRTGSNNNNTTWQVETYSYGGTIVQNYGYTNSNNFTTNIKLTYYISETTSIKYFDITKGYSIKDTNVVNTVWDNNYDNGKIQLLFRAQNTPGTYHNDIIVGDNSISIDYNPNKYLVSLNGADPVDIGTWRNIILDIDLINGELSAIPVRTFNNFTNVELDNTNIFIGDLINPTPTNIIKWVPTTNSLMFNVYSTSVFMDTYGVVMVNPTLNITSYFTDLNNFYQLKIYNISIYGQSMTINGVTGTVTGNNITFNNETVQIKDMSITYADGHAYISDSHVTIDLGEITDNTISMAGSWYFITDLMRGYTTYKMVYEWDWQDFILDNVQFCVIYIGLALIGLLIARHYCTLTITDYAIFLVSIVIALTIQVIA